MGQTSILTFVLSLGAVMDTSLCFFQSVFSHSRRAHHWKDCRLPVLSLSILPSQWCPHKARKAHQLYQPYWRWSKTRSECLLGLQTNMLFALEPWISVLTAFLLASSQDSGGAAAGKALNSRQWPLKCCHSSHLCRQSPQGEHLYYVCGALSFSWHI